MSFKNHENNPANQFFNVNPHFNKYKKRAWWQLGNSNNKKRNNEG